MGSHHGNYPPSADLRLVEGVSFLAPTAVRAAARRVDALAVALTQESVRLVEGQPVLDLVRERAKNDASELFVRVDCVPIEPTSLSL